MNCKEGDLAVLIWSRYGNAGKLVTCVKVILTPDRLMAEYKLKPHPDSSFPLWEIDRHLPARTVKGAMVTTNILPDHFLRPIRPIPGEEMTDITRLDTPVNSGKEKV